MRQFDENIDHAALAALGAIGVGWFLMTTFVVDFGLWQQGIRFYDVWAIIQDPAGRLSGINSSHALATFGFGLVCAAAIGVPAISIFYKRKDAGLAYLLPFIVMTVSCAVLYAKSSTSYFPADAGGHSVSALFARIAQGVAARAGDTVASRISIGAGAYVAMLCSFLLALRGVGMLRATARRAAAGGSENLAPPRQRDAGARQIEP
jgi:hypothetical protein